MPGLSSLDARRMLDVAASPWLRRVVLTLAVGALVATAIARRGDLVAAVQSAGPGGLLLAAAAVAASVIGQWLAWHRCLVGLGSAGAPRTTLTIFLLSLPGKYLPGGVWTTMLQVEHGAREGIDRPRMLGASVVSMLITVVVGALIGAALLLEGVADIRYGWLSFAVLVPGVALLLPPIQRRLSGTLRRLVNRGGAPVALPVRSTLFALLWTAVAWMFLGVHIFVLADAAVPVHRATAAFALSWTLGFIFVIAPAGAGIRDVALAAALGTSLDQGNGVAVALLSRAVVTLVDLFLAGAAIALTWRRSRRRQPGKGAVESS